MKFGRILLVIVAVGFGVRVGYVAFAKAGPCRITSPYGVASSPSECVVGDQIFYNAESNVVASGDGFVEPLWFVHHPGRPAPEAADHPPLTVIALTPVAWLSDHPPLSWVVHEPLHDHVREDRYAMALLGTIVVLLIGLLGRRVGGDVVGLVAAGIAAVTPGLWVNDGLVMSETITVLTVVSTMLLALALWDRPTWLRAAGLGAMCGLAALARAELILLALFAVVVAVTTRRSRADRAAMVAATLVACTIVIGPWVGFNLARFHDPTFLSTNVGLTLLGANCDPVYHGHAIGLWSQDLAGGCALDPQLPGDESQIDRAYRSAAVHYIEHHAGRVPLVAAARVGRLWSLYRPLDMVQYNANEGREPWTTRLGLVVYYPELIAALSGVVMLWRRRARFTLYVLLVPAVVATIAAAATHGQPRFRAIAEASLALLAAIAVVAIRDRLRPAVQSGISDQASMIAE